MPNNRNPERTTDANGLRVFNDIHGTMQMDGIRIWKAMNIATKSCASTNVNQSSDNAIHASNKAAPTIRICCDHERANACRGLKAYATRLKQLAQKHTSA